MEKLRRRVMEELKSMPIAPAVNLEAYPPDALLPNYDIETPEQVHANLVEYTKTHSAHFLWCVEEGLAGDVFS